MEELSIWISVCLTVSMVFAMATFIVYTVTPELKNLEGSIFRSCLAAYIMWLFCIAMWIVLAESKFSPAVMYFIEATAVAILYFGAAYMMWLNLMSFDIWRKFRNFQPSSDINMVKKRERAKFVRYSIYAWAGSLVPATFILVIGMLVPFLFQDYIGPHKAAYRACIMGLPILGTSVCNTCFYISTALTIRKLKKESANFTDGENKHHKENEQWFNLYLKLFVIMDGPPIFYIPVLYVWNQTILKFICVLEGLQGIFIFLMFVWKDDVKRSFRRRCVEVIRGPSSVPRPD